MKKDKNFIELFPLLTNRLIIRLSSINDVNLLLKMDKQKETQLFLGGIKNKTKEERLLFLEDKISKFNSFTICLKNDTPIGLINIIIKDNDAEISYILDHDFINNGYCTEACKKVIDVLINDLEIDEVKAKIVNGNNSSKRVLEKLGFKFKNEITKDSIKYKKYILKNGGK